MRIRNGTMPKKVIALKATKKKATKKIFLDITANKYEITKRLLRNKIKLYEQCPPTH
jgi:hypothetical protein